MLDRLILYLRIVHSVDYYNHCEYPNEDEMPNRCGIMHVRGSPPTAKVTSTELSEYCRNFESKMTAFLQPIATLSQEEFDKLGAKNAEAYPLFFFLILTYIHFSSFLLLLELFSPFFYCFLNLFKLVR